MNDHQIRVLSRIVDVIDTQRTSGSSRTQMFNDLWGLITAAELKGPARNEVEDMYYAASQADDAAHPWIPAAQRATDAEVEAAIDRLKSWACELRQFQREAAGDTG